MKITDEQRKLMMTAIKNLRIYTPDDQYDEMEEDMKDEFPNFENDLDNLYSELQKSS